MVGRGLHTEVTAMHMQWQIQRVAMFSAESSPEGVHALIDV